MPPARTCSECGQALPEDTSEVLCPVCALRSVADGGAEVEPKAQPAEPGGRRSVVSDQSSVVTPGAFGDYELLEEIGHGGMGVVYRARQRSLNRVVAIKMMAFGPGSSPDLVKRFRAEAVSAASMHHPNIVAIHEVGIHEDRHFFGVPSASLHDPGGRGRVVFTADSSNGEDYETNGTVGPRAS